MDDKTKVRFVMNIDKDLREFLREYAEDNFTTSTQVLVDHIVKLRKEYNNYPAYYKRNLGYE